MGLFPQHFIDDLRSQANIVHVVQDQVPLKRSGATYKGLCPFHQEKTPSFHVNGDKGFFHCFGCDMGGDVFKFVELTQHLNFPEAVRFLAQQCGVAVPESDSPDDQAAQAERESIIKMHELAADYFRSQLHGPAGQRARDMLQKRRLDPPIVEQLAVGFAPPNRDGLGSLLQKQEFDRGQLLRSGLVVELDGRLVDRFRNRLMFPICRDTGSVVAFGGRRMNPEQQPKYINSPETPIYSKGRTLYGLHVTKTAIRKLDYAVLVEGYFDFAQALQAGITPVVASCGTALTPAQARLLKRQAAKVLISFDPDTAGRTAAAKSCELLVDEGFRVKVAMLPDGEDPDSFIQHHGAEAYAEQLRKARPYLEYLLETVAGGYDFKDADDRREFLTRMLTVAARIPDAATRDQFADRLAHRAQVMEDVVRTEIRKAAMQKRTSLPSIDAANIGDMKQAEQGLIWAFVHEPESAVDALCEDELDLDDLEGLMSGSLLRVALSLRDMLPPSIPETLVQRLSTEEADVVRRIALIPSSPAPAAECIRALKRRRYERERAAVQREIVRLQELGAAGHGEQIEALLTRKIDLSQRIEAMNT